MRILRRLWAHLCGPSFVELALTTLIEENRAMNDRLAADIAAVKADTQALKELFASKIADLAAANAALAAAVAAGAPATQDVADAMAALEAVHGDMQSILAPAAPPAVEPAPEPAPTTPDAA